MDTVPEGRPDPGSATTPAEFLQALQRLRAWAGQPSLRTLTALAGTTAVPDHPPADVLPVSTLSDNLAGKRLPNLPRLEFVVAFVGACLRAGGHHGEDEIAAETDRWSRAWDALAPAEPAHTAVLPAPGVAEQPARPAGHRRRRGFAGRLPVVTGLLGLAMGAAAVWLAVPSAPAGTDKTRSSLPAATTPGAGHSGTGSSGPGGSTPPGSTPTPGAPPAQGGPARPAAPQSSSSPANGAKSPAAKKPASTPSKSAPSRTAPTQSTSNQYDPRKFKFASPPPAFDPTKDYGFNP